MLADPCGSPRDAVETLRAASEEKRSGRRRSRIRGQPKGQVASAPAASERHPDEDRGGGEERDGGGEENADGAREEETSREHGAGSRSPGSRPAAPSAEGHSKLMSPPDDDVGVEKNAEGRECDVACRETRAEALIAGAETAMKASAGIGAADGGGPTASPPSSRKDEEEGGEKGEAEDATPSADAERNQQLSLPLPPPPLPPAADLDPSNPYATIRCLFLRFLGPQPR